MNYMDFAQFGVGIFAVAGLVYSICFVTRKFLDFAKNQENNFNQTVRNHLKHNTRAVNKLDKTIRELVLFLKNNNNSNKNKKK